jgi:hypothetical protein
LPALLHAWQGCVVSQTESQQTPSTQWPCAHPASEEHVAPRSPMQLPVDTWQTWPAGQLATLQQTDTPPPAETQ